MAYTNNDIRKLLNLVVNKNRQGLLSYSNFNTLLWSETRNYFDLHLRSYEEDWKSKKTLRPFLIEMTGLTSSGSIPFSVFTGNVAKIIEARNDRDHHIEVIENEGLWYDRLDSWIKRPTKTYSIIRLKNNSIDLKPYLAVALKDIIYLKYPAKPYLDGLINDSTLEFIYLAEGEQVNLDTTYNGYTTIGGTSSGTSYDSKTSELEFQDEDKIEIAGRMLASLGITYSKQALFQYMRLTNE